MRNQTKRPHIQSEYMIGAIPPKQSKWFAVFAAIAWLIFAFVIGMRFPQAQAASNNHALTAKELAHWKAVDLRQRGKLDDGQPFFIRQPVDWKPLIVRANKFTYPLAQVSPK